MAAVTAAIIASAVISAGTAYEQSRKAKSTASKAKKVAAESNAVSRAEQQAQQGQNTRAQVREERIRRAQILQQSANTGVSGSSGEAGALGGLQTTIGSNLAAATRSGNAAIAITNLNQKAADIRSAGAAKVAQIGAIGSVAQAGISAYGAYKLTVPEQTTQVNDFTAVGGQSPATEKNPYSVNDLFK